jgi:hypothetical protein
MDSFRRRSRILKAMTDGARAGSFPEALARLDAIELSIVVGSDQVGTPAGQAALLTAVATAVKCFGRVNLASADDAPLLARLPIGATVMEAAQVLGATGTAVAPSGITHTIGIGALPKVGGWNVSCWWDRWLSGTRVFEDQTIGESDLPLAGVFAGALAVRQVFAGVVAGRDLPPRDVSVSLWTPWEKVDPVARGPLRFDVPDKLWLVGLGHLGQSYCWNLCFLGGNAERLAVLQDDQSISEENEGTSLLVLPNEGGKGERKTRLSARWFEACGWVTQLIERRHQGDIKTIDEDPPYLLCGLDRVEPRRVLGRQGFPFMVDAGIGHGVGDFDGIQIRVIAKGQSLDGLWEKPEESEEAVARSAQKIDKLLESDAYKELEERIGRCGTLEFAEASVAVPFVGAAAGALTVAQLIRLGTLQKAPLLFQMGLGAPEMPTLGGLTAQPVTNLGSFSIRLKD